MTATPARLGPQTRRGVLTGSAAVAVLAASMAAESCLPRPTGTGDGRNPAVGTAARRRTASRQDGVAGPQPRHVLLRAYDLRRQARVADLRQALGAVSRVRVSEGRAEEGAEGLTVTVATGPGLYRTLGLPAPARLRDVPAFPRDRLDPRRSGGDVLVQLCGEAPEDLDRAARRVSSALSPAFAARWHERGFLPPHAGTETPRNLFGFKDGTENPSPAERERWVWDEDGGSCLVYRRVHMETADFARLPRARQEDVIGRRLRSGAPLGGDREHDPVDLFAKTPHGRYVVPNDAHVRLAHSRLDGGARMLRRGYSYDHGARDRGLLFLAYMRDPALFTRVQQRLDATDALHDFVEHRASAVAYVLPVEPGGALKGP
ncbi:Dyp-type peroxidase [Streptomyces sp. NPDC048172]|uniref:Dyp-type peroxidase n=1 Tax=Streptomyces sp. NPDC048172 TaxID=3365505 RepID=UPI0037231391